MEYRRVAESRGELMRKLVGKTWLGYNVPVRSRLAAVCDGFNLLNDLKRRVRRRRWTFTETVYRISMEIT